MIHRHAKFYSFIKNRFFVCVIFVPNSIWYALLVGHTKIRKKKKRCKLSILSLASLKIDVISSIFSLSFSILFGRKFANELRFIQKVLSSCINWINWLIDGLHWAESVEMSFRRIKKRNNGNSKNPHHSISVQLERISISFFLPIWLFFSLIGRQLPNFTYRLRKLDFITFSSIPFQ